MVIQERKKGESLVLKLFVAVGPLKALLLCTLCSQHTLYSLTNTHVLPCDVTGHYEEAQLPYYDVVPMDPSFEDMKKAVVIEKKRPVIPNQWSQSEVDYMPLRAVCFGLEWKAFEAWCAESKQWMKELLECIVNRLC